MIHRRLSITHAALLGALALALSMHASAAEEPEKPRLAVLAWEARGAKAEEAEGVAEEVRSAFTRSGQYTVVDRTLTDKILEEWERQQSGLNESKRAVQVGRLYNVRYIVTGKLIRFEGNAWLISAALLDAQTGVTRDSQTLRHRGEFFDLLGQVPGLARRLGGQSLRAREVLEVYSHTTFESRDAAERAADRVNRENRMEGHAVVIADGTTFRISMGHFSDLGRANLIQDSLNQRWQGEVFFTARIKSVLYTEE
jgi:TolB-like protein